MTDHREHPPVHYFASMDDLDRSLGDPKLTALLEQGYRVESSVLAQAEQGHGIVLILVHRPDVVHLSPPGWRWLGVVGLCLVCMGFGLGATLVLAMGG